MITLCIFFEITSFLIFSDRYHYTFIMKFYSAMLFAPPRIAIDRLIYVIATICIFIFEISLMVTYAMPRGDDIADDYVIR